MEYWSFWKKCENDGEEKERLCWRKIGDTLIMSLTQVARKLAMVEADLERAEERAEAGES